MKGSGNKSGRMVARLRTLLRGLLVAGSMGLLAWLSFVFLPPEKMDDAMSHPARILPHHVEDPSPLEGTPLKVTGMEIRRLDRVAIVTMPCEIFDAQQNLLPSAHAQLQKFGRDLRSLRSKIAVEITGYAPEGGGSAGYAAGLLRASRVAEVLVNASDLQPSAVALRSLGDTEIHGGGERPHVIVITISCAQDFPQQFASLTNRRY